MILYLPQEGRTDAAVRLGFVASETTSTATGTVKFLLSRREAAATLGISLSHFQRHVQPHLRCVYCGQLRLYRPEDLEAWAKDRAVLPAGKA